jgi:hypothetical protein
MLKLIGLVVVVAVAAIMVLAATKPDNFRVQRVVTIQAPPDKVFALINDFHNWGAWSPWEKLDPEMKRSFGGPAAGKGANYAWEGNSKVGQGRMEIRESQPSASVNIQLDFLKPFEAHNTAIFSLQPAADGTHVSWAMEGPAPFMSKLMQVFVSMDSMIGKDFETGLANMKAAAEKK